MLATECDVPDAKAYLQALPRPVEHFGAFTRQGRHASPRGRRGEKVVTVGGRGRRDPSEVGVPVVRVADLDGGVPEVVVLDYPYRLNIASRTEDEKDGDLPAKPHCMHTHT
jgi:hypothetical protein